MFWRVRLSQEPNCFCLFSPRPIQWMVSTGCLRVFTFLVPLFTAFAHVCSSSSHRWCQDDAWHVAWHALNSCQQHSSHARFHEAPRSVQGQWQMHHFFIDYRYKYITNSPCPDQHIPWETVVVVGGLVHMCCNVKDAITSSSDKMNAFSLQKACYYKQEKSSCLKSVPWWAYEANRMYQNI